jgi:hypothetical protein
MELLKLLGKIVGWGVAIVTGAGLPAYGIVCAARDAKAWGLPAYAWFTIGWAFTVAVLIAFSYRLWGDNKRLKADPRIRFQTLVEESKLIIAKMDNEMKVLIEAAEPLSETAWPKFGNSLFQLLNVTLQDITTLRTFRPKVRNRYNFRLISFSSLEIH